MKAQTSPPPSPYTAALASRRVRFGSPTWWCTRVPGLHQDPPALGTSQPASDSPAALFQLTLPDS